MACIRWVLPEPRVPVDEQGVVGLGRRLGHGEGRGVGHLVVRPDDEGLEGVADVERARARARGHRCGPRGAGAERACAAGGRGSEIGGPCRGRGAPSSFWRLTLTALPAVNLRRCVIRSR